MRPGPSARRQLFDFLDHVRFAQRVLVELQRAIQRTRQIAKLLTVQRYQAFQGRAMVRGVRCKPF